VWTDRQLLEDFTSRRDEAAFAALVSRHGPMVLRVCRRVLHHEQDAEDAFQATFLALAGHAGSIRKRDTVGDWLHGVAYRTAMKVKRSAARRRNHEARLRTGVPPAAVSPTWDDVQAVLDDEIQRLPACFREAFVLVVLGGKAGPDAAAELGCKEGTVKSRVSRARRLLEQQMRRRGIKLTALLAALAVAEGAGRATPPAALARAAVRSGLLVAAGKSAAGQIPRHLTALAEGVTKAMFLTQTKLAAVALLATGLLIAGGGALAFHTLAAQEPAPTAAGPSQAPAARAGDAEASAVFRGRVLDPDGKPLAGARLHLLGSVWNRPTPVHVQATSAADGAFRLPVAAADARRLADEASWSTTAVVATADGYGPAVNLNSGFAPASDLTLQLVRDDVPVRGRLLDLQGQPLAGVTVRVEGLSVPNDNDLTPWLTALQANKDDGYAVAGRYLVDVRLAEAPGIYPAVVTDAAGHFQIKGVGRERVVELVLEGPTIAREHLSVYTRPGKPIHARMFARNPDGGRLTYYGADFDHLAAPTRPITGVVRDRDTGKPLAGVTIQSDRFAGCNAGGDSSVHTTTDKDGRYRLLGMPKGVGNVIKAVPAPGQPYFQSAYPVPDPLGLEPITADFTLKRGVLVKGRVLDKATGQPVYARVGYVVFRDNPRHGQAPGFATDHYLETGDDGSYQLVAFPGRGILFARGWNDHYRMGVGAAAIPGKIEQGLFNTLPHFLEPNTSHAYVELNPPDGAESVPCDVHLDPGPMPHGSLAGPDGKPLTGVLALGLTAYARSRNWTRAPLKRTEFTVYGLETDEEREVVFVHAERQLAGVVRVRGAAREPLRVKLEPWATVTGRLVGPDGTPLAGQLLRGEDRFLPGTSFQTDKDGRFHIAGLAPGVSYTMHAIRSGQATAAVFAGLALKSAEVRNLGDVVVQLKK
jgi:RNA polymerase sigma factor (sigma-70 family)